MNPFEPTKAIAEARRAGIDLDLLDSNLALTVKERWQQHDAAWDLVVKLQAARKKLVTAKELRAIAARRKA